MVQPAVLVDVDGVLNAFFPCNKPRPTCKCHPGWTRLRARPFGPNTRGFKLTLTPAHGPLLLGLAADTGAELVWGTTWNDSANEWVSPTVGLPTDLPHVPIPPPIWPGRIGEWKANWIAEYLGPERPFVWFEDEKDAPAAAAALAAKGELGEHLVVTVDATVGLTEAEVAEARDWLLLDPAA